MNKEEHWVSVFTVTNEKRAEIKEWLETRWNSYAGFRAAPTIECNMPDGYYRRVDFNFKIESDAEAFKAAFGNAPKINRDEWRSYAGCKNKKNEDT